jgi:hypothetical protein
VLKPAAAQGVEPYCGARNTVSGDQHITHLAASAQAWLSIRFLRLAT